MDEKVEPMPPAGSAAESPPAAAGGAPLEPPPGSVGLDELLRVAEQAGAAPIAEAAAPGEAETISAKPARALPPDLRDALGNVIYQLRVALSNLQLYPAGSRQALKAASGVYSPLAEMLEKVESLTLSDADNVLVANGAAATFAGSAKNAGEFFLSLLKRTGIKSLTFKMGLGLEELYKFLEGFNQKRWEKERQKSLQQVVREEGINHILINERVFVSVSERDLVIEGGTVLLEKSGRGLDSIMNVIQEVMEMTEIEDQGTRDEVRMEVARRLVQSDPMLLPKLLEGQPIEVPQAPKPEEAKELPDVVPREMLREVVCETARVYRELLRHADPLSEVGRQVEALKKVLSRLLTLVEGKVDALGIYQELLQSGSADLLPSWWGLEQGIAEGDRPEEQAEAILGRDPISLVDDETRKDLPRLVRDLDLKDRPDLTERLLERYAENLTALTANIRKKTVEGFKEILAAAKTTSKPEVVEQLDPAFLEAGEKETDEKVYEDLASILKERADDLMKKGNYEKTREILSLFRRHRDPKAKGFDQRPLLADRTLEELARGDVMDLLLSDLKSGDPARQDRARGLLVKMEEFGVGRLLEEVKANEDLRVRQLLVSVAENVGESALARLIAELDEVKESAAITRIMEVIRNVGMDPLVLEVLKKLVVHPERKVRAEAVKTLFHKGSEEAAALIATRLSDEDDQVRIAAIRSVGALKFREAAPRLHEIVESKGLFAKEEDTEVLEAACASLGRIGEESSVAVLLSVLSGGSMLKKVRPKIVRIAAARALAAFTHRPDVREGLLAALKDKDPYLRKTVQDIVGR